MMTLIFVLRKWDRNHDLQDETQKGGKRGDKVIGQRDFKLSREEQWLRVRVEELYGDHPKR
jgi:hypothetical protein